MRVPNRRMTSAGKAHILPQMRHHFTYINKGERRAVSVGVGEGNAFNVEVDGQALSLDVSEVAPGRYHLLQDGAGEIGRASCRERV